MFFNYKKVIYSGFLLLQSICLSSQGPPPIEVYGNVTDANRDLVGVLIQVSQGGKLVNSTKTDPNGEYSFQLPQGGEFLAVVSREGYVTKRFTVSTMNIPTDNPELKFQPIGAAISLFKKVEGVDYSLLNQPIMKFNYDPEKESFSYDKKHLDEMLIGLDQIEQAEMAILNKEKEKEAKYAALMKSGDKAFGKKEWQTAIASYKEASAMKPKEAYPQDQIVTINKMMEETALQNKLNDEAKTKLAAELAAKKAADEAAAKLKGDAEASAKAKADKELADKLAAEKAAAEARTKAEAELRAKEAASALLAVKAAEAAKAKAEQEQAERLAKEKADAAAKAKADEEAKTKLIADTKAKADQEATQKKLADEAAAKANAAKIESDRLAKEKADAELTARKDALAKEAAELALVAKLKAEKEDAARIVKEKALVDSLTKKQTEDAALSAAKKVKEDQLSKEKMDAAAKANAEALAKKQADEDAAKIASAAIIAKVAADQQLADKLAKEKEAEDAKALLAAKEKAAAEDLAKKQAAEAERLKNEKELAEALAKSEADKKIVSTSTVSSGENITANVSDGKDKSILPLLGEDPKYKEAIRKGDNYFALKRYMDAKRSYEEALTFKGGDAYAKERLLECEKMISSDANQITDERQKQLLAKYPEGVTEETISAEGVVIIKRVLVKNRTAWVYEKKVFNWGGTACFRDGSPITELVFEQETKK
ncbi:MAG: carboxypeptidase regulatory-like domain-containing protein [bacterium]|nr:carboxypeptidase regulatory-like domain-containing protein [bacterium]